MERLIDAEPLEHLAARMFVSLRGVGEERKADEWFGKLMFVLDAPTVKIIGKKDDREETYWERDKITGDEFVRCHACGELYEHEGEIELFTKFYRFCPSCGRKVTAKHTRYQSTDTCICCGEPVTEGRIVCPKCKEERENP